MSARGRARSGKRLKKNDAFQRQQLPLGRQALAAGEAAFLAAAAQYAVAGHDDGDGIARAGHANGTRARAERHRHAAIGRGFAVADVAHHRQLIFALSTPVQFDQKAWDKYWP